MRKVYFLIGTLFFSLIIRGQVTLLSENFNGVGTPLGWSTSNSSFGGTPENAVWTLRPDGYTYMSFFVDPAETFHSNDNSQFYLSNSDEQGPDYPAPYTETILESPGFSTVGYTTVTLQIYHYFLPNLATDGGYVEASTDGINWTNVVVYHTTRGTASAFEQRSIDISVYAGNATVYVRFRYVATFGFYWAIDNVTITGLLIPTPVSLLAFSGYREANHNLLKWTTASEQNNKGFQIERSTDGTNYSSIGFVNSRAANGNSSSLLQYTFNDNNLSGSKQYYRLRQIDIDNREKLSNIILIKGQRPTVLALSGLFPNPASNILNMIVDAPAGDDVELMITDINGRLIKQQSAPVEAGTNTIAIDISRFASGTYTIQLTCKSNCKTLTGKFVKQ